MTAFAAEVGKKGAALYYSYKVLAACGLYSSARIVDWKRVSRVVFVCTGNICRSPYAQYRMSALGVNAASCGTRAIHGAPADAVARRVAQLRGVDLRTHSSTPARDFQYQATDLVVAMEPAHLREAVGFASRAQCQATLLGVWCDSPAPYIPDPFGRSDACFEAVFGLVDQALDNLRAGLRPVHVSQAELL